MRLAKNKNSKLHIFIFSNTPTAPSAESLLTMSENLRIWDFFTRWGVVGDGLGYPISHHFAQMNDGGELTAIELIEEFVGMLLVCCHDPFSSYLFRAVAAKKISLDLDPQVA